jgi:hypothetical protein
MRIAIRAKIDPFLFAEIARKQRIVGTKRDDGGKE